jgi:hypothetical protein
MIKILGRLLIILSLALLNSLVSFSPPSSPEDIAVSDILAGAAKVNITPITPIPMSGYGGRKDPFTGIHDSLFLTAVVFSDGSRKAAIITADLIGFSHRFCGEVISKIEEAAGIHPDYILLAASHNHGGPANMTYSEKAIPEVEAYANKLQESIIKAVKIAGQKLQPVLIGAGKGICNMNINRRARFADGNIWLGRNPDGPCDHEVSVLKIEDLDKNPIALLVNWPCHGSTGGGENYQITGDWPGATARFIEKGLDGKVIVHVTAGASADINPIYGPNDKFQDIDAIGMLLGEEVLSVAKEIKVSTGGSIQAVKKTVIANGKKRLESRLPDQELEAGEDVEIVLSALKIGNVVFAGISGELMTEIGLYVKKKSPFVNTVVVTHCNGNSGYLCIDGSYPEGGYEIMVTRTMPGTEALVSENLLELIYQFN